MIESKLEMQSYRRGGRNRQQGNQNQATKQQEAKQAQEKEAVKEEKKTPPEKEEYEAPKWLNKMQEAAVFIASRDYWVTQFKSGIELGLYVKDSEALIAHLENSGENKAVTEAESQLEKLELTDEMKEVMLAALKEKFVTETDMEEEIDLLDELIESVGDENQAKAWLASWMELKAGRELFVEKDFIEVSENFDFMEWPEEKETKK